MIRRPAGKRWRRGTKRTAPDRPSLRDQRCGGGYPQGSFRLSIAKVAAGRLAYAGITNFAVKVIC
jgi:hypothetical protein